MEKLTTVKTIKNSKIKFNFSEILIMSKNIFHQYFLKLIKMFMSCNFMCGLKLQKPWVEQHDSVTHLAHKNTLVL